MRASKLTSSDVKKCRANHVMPRQCMPLQGSERDLLKTIASSACLLCQNVDVHMRQTRISRLVANSFTIIQKIVHVSRTILQKLDSKQRKQWTKNYAPWFIRSGWRH